MAEFAGHVAFQSLLSGKHLAMVGSLSTSEHAMFACAQTSTPVIACPRAGHVQRERAKVSSRRVSSGCHGGNSRSVKRHASMAAQPLTSRNFCDFAVMLGSVGKDLWREK